MPDAAHWFRRLSLGQKFLLSFGVLLSVLGLSLATVLFHLGRINSYIERHDRITVPALTTAAEMRRRAAEMTLLLHRLLENPPSKADEHPGVRLRALQRDMFDAYHAYRSSHAVATHPVLFAMLTEHGRTALIEQEHVALDAIDHLLKQFAERWEAFTGFIEAGHRIEARRALLEVDRLFGRLSDHLTVLIELNSAYTAEMKVEGNSLFSQAGLVIFALIVALGSLIVATYALVMSQIARPLRQLASDADRVAHQDLTTSFKSWSSEDEVGRLTASLQLMLSTIRERTVALERKTRELEAFTYSVAHDLKGPLREIEGFSALIERMSSSTLEDKPRHYLEMIRHSALRMTSLIEGLLRYSRIEQQNLPKTQVNVLAMLEHLVRDCRSRAGATNAVMSLDLPFTHLWAEATSLQQVFINLIDNALKFSRSAAQPEVSIGGMATETEQVFWVRDNGIGFDPKDAPKLFGLFHRLSGGGPYEGTGVGLAIVKLVMEKHGGRVWAESSPAKGATLFLAFPLEPGRATGTEEERCPQ